MMGDFTETVAHLKKKLEKGVGYEKTLHILHKLQKIPITIELLQNTGIGKTVRQLSKKYENDIGKTAKVLCLTWKHIVKEQQQQEEQEDNSFSPNQVSDEANESSPHQEYEETSADKKSKKTSDKTNYRKEYNLESNEKIKVENKSKSNHEKVKKRKHKNYEEEDDETAEEPQHHKTPSKSQHKKQKNKTDYNQVTDFEACLGLNDEIAFNKKLNHKSSNKNNQVSINGNDSIDRKKDIKKETKNERVEKKSSKRNTDVSVAHTSFNSHVPPLIDHKEKLKPLNNTDILSSLPTPNYKPLPIREIIDERIEANRKKKIPPTEDLSLRVQSKKGRTAVFAGHARSNVYTHVYKLEDLCIRVLMDNVDKLSYFGDAPYYLIKPILQKCNAKQLSRLEKINPNLIEDSDELWREFCNKEFRDKEPDEDEDETWRELYFRSIREREDRLKNITAHINKKQLKSLPVRKTQMAYTNNNPKPPKEVLRKQERAASSNSSSHSNVSTSVKYAPEKPKVAPLMKKALMMQKMKRFRR